MQTNIAFFGEAAKISFANMDKIARKLDALPFFDIHEELLTPDNFSESFIILGSEKNIASKICPNKMPALNKIEKLMKGIRANPNSLRTGFFKELKSIAIENNAEKYWVNLIDKAEAIFEMALLHKKQACSSFRPRTVFVGKPIKNNKPVSFNSLKPGRFSFPNFDLKKIGKRRL